MHDRGATLPPWPPTKSPFALCRALAILLVLAFAQPAAALDNATRVDCSTIHSCGKCVAHLGCGFCVRDNACVNGGWNGPFKDQNLCPTDRWEYQFGQCFITHKQAIISLFSATVGILLVLLTLCLCCCLCRCCRNRPSGTDEERNPLLGGDTVATNHFRRASFFNYNRNRPFERRGRTLSTGTANSAMQYGRNWRGGEEFFGPPPWNDQNQGASSVDYTIGSQNNYANDWRRWERKREELLAKYGKSNEG